MAPLMQAKGGWRFGEKGKVYQGPGAKTKATRQGRAIKASQSRRRLTNVDKAKIAISSAHRLQGPKQEFLAISNRADKLISKGITTPTKPKTMRFGGAAGSMKVLHRIIFPSVTLGTSREAQRRGLPKRIHAKIAANIVHGRPRVDGYMYEPPIKTSPVPVEVFTTLQNFKQDLKPTLVHELTHVIDYAKKGSAHNLWSEKKAYSYQFATVKRQQKASALDPYHETTWKRYLLSDPATNAHLNKNVERAVGDSHLKQCYNCNEEYSSNYKRCPHCGTSRITIPLKTYTIKNGRVRYL